MKCAKFLSIAVAAFVVVAVSGCKVSHTIKVKQSQPEQEQDVQIDSNGTLTPLTLIIYNGKIPSQIETQAQSSHAITQVLH